MIAEATACHRNPSCRRTAAERILNSDSLPVVGTTISSIDLDLTVKCNLNCDYCFKEKKNKDMSLATAQDAVVWLIFASLDVKKIYVNMIGGEPLLKFDMISRLVPFAKRRAYQHNKLIHFGITTNGTIMSQEILDFWRQWNIGFHTSIDGCPPAHDRHRHFRDGRPSSSLLERNIPKILAIRPNTTARATILPDTVKYMARSFDYLLNMGYRSMAFVPGSFAEWNRPNMNKFREQFRIVSQRMQELFRKGSFVRLKFFDEGCKSIAEGQKSRAGRPACGAGRGMVLIDVNGDIWPCHRWSKKRESEWRLGSIYDSDFNYEARGFINTSRSAEQLAACQDCPALFICAGGCPAENLENTGSIFGRHPAGCELAVALAGLIRQFHDTLFAEKNPVFMKAYYKSNQATNGKETR
jgi:uncharacterized protein